ncbi:MAG: PAS domain-containing protein [Candidatus Pacearchaeota archaeon]|jgi:PAS domain S-box-containing protein
MEILKEIFDKKIVSILEVFVNEPNRTFTISEISKLAEVNITATFRIIRKLVTKRFIKIKFIGKMKFYQLEKNDNISQLLNFLDKNSKPLESFVEESSKIENVEIIILDNKTKESAKFFFIGEEINNEKIKKISDKIKDKFDINIDFVILNKVQYESLKNFGNYSLEKNIIWEKDNNKLLISKKEKSIPDEIYPAIFTIDKDGMYISMNKNAAKRIGGKPEDFIGKKLIDVFPKEIVKKQMDYISTLIKTGKIIKTIDEIPLGNNKIHLLETTLKPIKNSEGKIEAILGISHDISEEYN